MKALKADTDIDLILDNLSRKYLIIIATQARDAINKLKRGKGDGLFGVIIRSLSSDRFINASDSLSVHIAFLFSSMLEHGIPPDNLTFSTLIPIPKKINVKKLSSDNYQVNT
jgi:hypothetical protein